MTDRSADRAEFERLVAALRPNLHRYCARMTGSVIDGEDVVQEALLKAFEALSRTGPIANPGLASLQAAMHPAKVQFLYFVSDNNGHHRFARDLEEHARNVAAYRRSVASAQ